MDTNSDVDMSDPEETPPSQQAQDHELEVVDTGPGPSSSAGSRLQRRLRRISVRQEQFNGVGIPAIEERDEVEPSNRRVTGFREVTDSNGETHVEFIHSDSEDSSDDPDYFPIHGGLAEAGTVEPTAGGSHSHHRGHDPGSSSDPESDEAVPNNLDSVSVLSSDDELDVWAPPVASLQIRRRKRKIVRKEPKNLPPLAPKTIRRKVEDADSSRFHKIISDDCLKQKCYFDFQSQLDNNDVNCETPEYVIGNASLTLLDCNQRESYSTEDIKQFFPDLTEITLHISAVPTRSVLAFKSERTVSEEEACLVPKPKFMKMIEFRRRKLNYIDEVFVYHTVEHENITSEVLQGLATRSQFSLNFVQFDAETAQFEFDVILRGSTIYPQHAISDIPSKKSKPVVRALEHFLGLNCIDSSFTNLDKKKEDIDWFYGQIKKYHESEKLPLPEFSTQHPSLIPLLRDYQKRAVHWMLHREGVLSQSLDTKLNLATCFLDKMYTPVSLRRKYSGAVEEAYYNPFIGYICREPPKLPTLEIGGILADEMGLGKTVVCLSLILLHQRDESLDAKTEDNYKISTQEAVQDALEKDEKPLKRKTNSTETEFSLNEIDDTGKNVQFIHPSLKRKRCVSPCEFEANNITIKPDSMSPESSRTSPNLMDVDNDDDESRVDESNSGEKRSKKRRKKRGAKKWSKQKAASRVKNPGRGRKSRSQVNEPVPKKETTYDRVKLLYDVALGSYNESKNANTKPRFHGKFFNPNIARRICFECICGQEKDTGGEIAVCINCKTSQHLACVGIHDVRNLERILKSYLCPHCTAASPPLYSKTTLIITPGTISHQWISEIQRHIKDQHVSILLYKGVSKHGYIPPSKLAEYDIVITTYGVLSKEINYVDLPHNNSEQGRRYRNPKRYATIPSPLPSVHWWRVCLDEAQMVESGSTKMAMMALTLKAVHRWCVTGTPINKGLDDLYGLVAFLGISPIDQEYWWNALVCNAFYKKETKLLYELFGQVIWRTGKADVLDQLGIPPQSQQIHWLNFSPVEAHFYKRHHENCASKILEKISKITTSVPHATGMKLSALDRRTLQDLLIPFLELRQACCHPQLVKGHSFAISKLTGTLTMEQLLVQLIQKTIVQCAEDHRQVVANLNGMAGIHIIMEQYDRASDKYREVIQLANKHENKFSTDTLQMLHTFENLADLIDRNYSGVGYTLRDDELRTNSKVLKDKYLQKYADGVAEASVSAERTTKAVDSLRDKFICTKQSWWIFVLQRASKIHKIEDLVSRIKSDLIVYASKRKHSGSLANRFNDASGLEHNLVSNITEMDSLRVTILDTIDDIQKLDPNSLVDEALVCHIGKGSIDFHKSRNKPDTLCRLCKNLETFYLYESLLYSEQDKKEKIDRTGRNRQKKLQTGRLNKLTEEEERLVLVREQEELLETTEHVNLKTTIQGAASWKDSDTEKALKQLLGFGKTNGCGEMVIHDGNNHMKLFQAMKMEFKVLRILWSQIFDRVSAIDELNQATTRLRVRSVHERENPRPSTSKKLKSLATGMEERDQKIATINILEPHEVEHKLREMELECASAKSDFNVHMGQTLYLETLSEKGYGKTGTSNLEECPICQIGLGNEWCVLPCGHSFCANCLKKLCSNHNMQTFLCPLCRQTMKVGEVSFVDTTVEEEVPVASTSKGPKLVRGSQSTKVEGVVEKLMELQDSNPGAKVLIFSTWSEVLSIVGQALEENDIKYCSLTSGGKPFQVNLERFKKRDDIQVLLMLITSGSKGLNLIEATHVFLVEPILNLASELQAIGRVHRIGQTKPTFVHRFYVKKTIEEQLQEVLKAQDVSNDEETLTVAELRKLVAKEK